MRGGIAKWLLAIVSVSALGFLYLFLRPAHHELDLAPGEAGTDALAPGAEPALESAPVEERHLVHGDLVIHVEEADGRPFAGDSVVLVRDGHGLATGPCNASGVVRFDAHPGPLEVLALSGTWVRARWSMANGIGSHSFVLPAAAGARGILMVDGASPARRIDLSLETDPSYQGIEEAPTFVFRSFGWPGQRGTPYFPVKTDPDGRFHVPGLTADWIGRISLPPEYQTMAGEGFFAVQRGAHDLVLLATWRPAIRGRAVAASGVPVPLAAARYEAACADGEFSGSVEGQEDGAFRIPIICGPIEAFSLRLTAAGLASDAVALGAVPEEGIDLGDIPLHSNRGVSLRVLDDRGLPVERAIAVLGLDPLDCSDLSDSEGRLEVPYLSAGTSLLAVHALGHRPTQVPVTGMLPEWTEVRLERVHVLQVDVAGPAAGAAGARLVLATESVDAFEIPYADVPESFQRELGASSAIQRTTGADTGLRHVYDCRERTRIVGLRSETVVDLEVFGTDGARLAGPLGVRIGGPGLQVVRLDTKGQAFDVPLLVADEAGEPIFMAFVHAAGFPGTLAKTRLDGTAEVRGVFLEGPVLSLRRSGYLPQELVVSDPSVPPAGGRHRVTLRDAASFRVMALTEAGAIAAAEWVEVRHEGRKVGAVHRIDSGTFAVEEVPRQPLILRLTLGGRAFERSIPGPLDTQISVPAYSSVDVTWRGAELEPQRWYVLDLEPIAAESGGLRRPARGEEWTRGVTLPAVFPGTYRACLVDPEGPSQAGSAEEIALGCADLLVGSQQVTLTVTDG